jgi:hypothetical protein
MTNRMIELAMLAALAVTTIGMALITFGVAVAFLFFPGVYLLAAGLLATAVTGLLKWLRPRAA